VSLFEFIELEFGVGYTIDLINDVIEFTKLGEI